MEGVLFLAGFTSRSIAYTQAMMHSHLQPEDVLLFGDENGNAPGQSVSSNGTSANIQGILLPDFRLSQRELLSKYNWSYSVSEETHINSSTICNYLMTLLKDCK